MIAVSFLQAAGLCFLLLLLSAPWWMRLSKRLVQVSWCRSLWWAEPCQGVCLASSCVLRKTLSCPSADGCGCVPALLVAWHEASQHWSLQAVRWCQVLVRKWWPLGGLTPMSTPQNYRCQCLCPCSRPQLPPTSAGDPPILAGKSGLGFYEATAFFPGSWCTQEWGFCALQEGSFCFPQSYGIPAVKPC